MSQSLLPSAAGRAIPAVAPAMLERHGAALRKYLGQLPGAETRRVEAVIQAVLREIEAHRDVDDDPLVWLFARARQQMVGAGQRGDVRLTEGEEPAEGDESVEAGDSRMAVHRAFGRLTGKQQEALRLKFQFGFNNEEMARITGLSMSGAAGLQHNAMDRIVQALAFGPDRSGIRISDPRMMSYALDEMGADEKKAFVESVPDGKALLEASEAVRRAARELRHLLESGAPPPKRRRTKRGVSHWLRPMAAVMTLLLIGGGVWWWSSRPSSTERGVEHPPAADSQPLRETARGITAPTEPVENNPEATARSDRSRSLRPGEAEWERKAFGRGTGRSARNTGEGSGGGAPVSDADQPAVAGAGGGPISDDDKSDDIARPEPSSGADADDPPVVMRPETGASALGGAVIGLAESAKFGGPGAGAGSTMVQSQVVFSGPVPDGIAEKKPVVRAKPLTAGLPEMKRPLARRESLKLKPVKPGELLRQVPEEWPATGQTKDPLAVRMEMAPSPFSPGRQLLRVEIRARPAPPPSRPPANLVLAIDVSASMKVPNRLPLVQEGIRLLAERLRPDDQIAIVTYAAEAREVRPSAPVGENGRELRDALNALVPEGRTNGYEGLTLAYAVARKTRSATGLNAVILCTDGNFNLGETDGLALAELAAQAAADGIALSVFGFGRSDRNDLRLEMLAQQGGGRSCYVNTREEAERLLAGQIDGLLAPVATDVTWRVAFNPAQVIEAKILGGSSEEPAVELLPGRSLTALYELNLKTAGPAEAARWAEVQIDFHDVSGGRAQLRQMLDRSGADMTETGPDFRFAVAMSELGRIFQGEATDVGPALERLEVWVRLNLPEDDGGYRRDLLDTMAAARLDAVP